MLSTNNVPPTVRMVREPSFASTGASMRLTTNPIDLSVPRTALQLHASDKLRFTMTLRKWAMLIAAGLLMTMPLGAINIEVTDADISRAISIAVGQKPASARFHAPYILQISAPAVERAEVITEFRRFVLASEEQSALGNWSLARGGYDAKGRTLRDLLQKWRGQVSIKARMRFHPQHSYAFMPAIDVLIGEPSFQGIDVVRAALMTSGTPTSMTGAVVEAAFNAPSFHDRTVPVRIVLEGKELARVTVDFSKLE